MHTSFQVVQNIVHLRDKKTENASIGQSKVLNENYSRDGCLKSTYKVPRPMIIAYHFVSTLIGFLSLVLG